MAWEKQAYTCAEMKPGLRAPKKLTEIFEDPNVQLSNKHEVFLCILHVLTMEENFIPCTTLNLWQKTHFYSISYLHPTTGDLVCQLKYLPLDSSGSAIVFGVAGTKEVSKKHLDCEQYIQDETHKDPRIVYKSVSDLSITFKDNIVKNMLVGAQECANVNPTFGLSILATEMKLEILYRMDPTGLLALSRVNQEFNQLIDSAIWQLALFRDFPKHADKTEEDWKQLYKIEFLAKKAAEKKQRERLKKEKEEREREIAIRRMRGIEYFEDQSRLPFADPFGPPSRHFGFPPEPQRRRFGFPQDAERRIFGHLGEPSKRSDMPTIRLRFY